jgi:recombinational DNA repair protein RecT
VREKDTFKVYTDKDGRNIQHEEATGNRGDVTHAYCIAWLTSGRTIIEVMDRNALSGCRDAAARKNNGQVPFVWKGAFREEMYKKSVLRRAWKHFPKMTNPNLVAMMEAVDRTDPMEFENNTPVNELNKETLTVEQLKEFRDIMDAAGVNRAAQAATMNGIANSLGFPSGIRVVPQSMYTDVKSTLEKGLAQWKERSSHLGQSDSKQEENTAQRGAV